MLLSIRHATTYTYDQPVLLEPHCLRLTPRADGYASLVERSIKIVPTPSFMSIGVENDGSISHWVRFEGMITEFSVEAKTVVNIIEDKNPFDFLIYPTTCQTLPMNYTPKVSRELRTYLSSEIVAPKVKNFAFDLVSQTRAQTMDFLVALSQIMKNEFVYEFRQEGAPHQPEHTLLTRRGSCRDFAILFMAAANAVGLATRFVSGYYFDENPKDPDLHAWVEVYIPGGGWRGFDPSIGLACYGHHIALATSSYAAGAAPIQGTFKGSAKSEMKLELEYKYSLQ